MAEVEAHIWYWSPAGMQQRKVHPALVGYIEQREVERLLEAAHQRGFEQGIANAMHKIRSL